MVFQQQLWLGKKETFQRKRISTVLKWNAFLFLPFEGSDWQRVERIKKFGRGGALGFSATLAKHSGASRTSAILRGMWVSEVLLGDKIPNPPKGVPTLPEEAPDGLSERQLIER
ncbi:MAG: DUF1588 domain-containing protein, partial [Sediminibacterium sp.]